MTIITSVNPAKKRGTDDLLKLIYLKFLKKFVLCIKFIVYLSFDFEVG